MTKRDQPVPSAEEIIAAMAKGKKYRSSEIALKFKCDFGGMTAKLRAMSADGRVQKISGERETKYAIGHAPAPAENEVEKPLQDNWKPLGILDISTHQRLCEGARNPVTGVV